MNFCLFLKKRVVDYVQQKGDDFDLELGKANQIWQLGLLKEIAASQHTIEEKLSDIENVWARFNYPEIWSEFIYYMPNENLKNQSKYSVYDLFTKFIVSQEGNLIRN